MVLVRLQGGWLMMVLVRLPWWVVDDGIGSVAGGVENVIGSVAGGVG